MNYPSKRHPKFFFPPFFPFVVVKIKFNCRKRNYKKMLEEEEEELTGRVRKLSTVTLLLLHSAV
jgi:hypothetical protein